MTSRREFIEGAALAAAGTLAAGCRATLREEKSAFYGPTIRDRLWMWGHHADMAHKSVKKGAK